MKRNILITGGAGFIGSHVVRFFVNKYPQYRILNMDLLTYAGNLNNLKEIEHAPNYQFIKQDIGNFEQVIQILQTYAIDGVIHLAAESHVDRSIQDPFVFARTNVMGTLSLLEATHRVWQGNTQGKLFYHISTDEVYGALPLDEASIFTEQTKYDPHSPYSASKASSDHFVRAYHSTYGLPIVISNCSNNYGSYQYPEKMIPLCIANIVQKKKIPVYGNGQNVRDWLHVQDHVRAIDLIFHKGEIGHTYNVGADNQWKNIDLVRAIVKEVDKQLSNPEGTSDSLITFVTDRPGHDLRYAIDATKIRTELGWEPLIPFEQGLAKTIQWYLSNHQWLHHSNWQK